MAGLSKENPLKDVFNRGTVASLAEALAKVWPSFDKQSFQDAILSRLGELGFGARSALIRDALRQYLPQDYPRAISILLDALGPELANPGEAAWEAFTVMPQCAFVSKYGTDHVDLSLRALYEMTKRFTAEGDLRTFLEVDYETTMRHLHRWCQDPSAHVRRLVSEGTRPRLPLAPRIKRFQQDPAPVLELLEKLHNDTSLYVRRSVANNINDIAKDHPQLAIGTLRRWSQEQSPESRWLVHHAARTLVKQGNTEVLGLLNFDGNPKIEVVDLRLSQEVISIGDTVTTTFDMRSVGTENYRLMVDYVVGFVKANGTIKDKVFKYRELTLSPGETQRCQFRHTFRDTSGRRHYPGVHSIELQVNGERFGRRELVLRPLGSDPGSR